jgi:hypothetical protein
LAGNCFVVSPLKREGEIRGFVLAAGLCQNDSVPFACFQNETGGIVIRFWDFTCYNTQRPFCGGKGKRK